MLRHFSVNINPLLLDANGTALVKKIVALNPEEMENSMSLLLKYFSNEFPQLLGQRDAQGENALEFAIKNHYPLLPWLAKQLQWSVSLNIDQVYLATKAVEAGDHGTVLIFLHNQDLVHSRDANGKTLLMIASAKGFLSIVHLLLERGARSEEIDRDFNTALHLAIMNKQSEIAQLLASSTLDIDRANREGETAFLLAAKYGLTQLLGQIYATSRNHNATDKDGYGAVHLATLFGHQETLIRLLELGFDPEVQASAPAKGNLPYYGSRPLHIALLHGKIKCAVTLLEYGADTYAADNDGDNAFYYGATSESEAAYYFLKTLNGFYDRANQLMALKAAVNKDKVYIVNHLYLLGVALDHTDKQGINLLHLAAIKRAHQVLQFLLEHGIGVNLLDSSGNSALFYAVQANSPSTIAQLVQYGADINAKNGHGSTSLMQACKDGSEAIVLQLLKYGANFLSLNNQLLTAAQIAVLNNNVVIAQLLFVLGDRSLLAVNGLSHVLNEALIAHKSLIDKLKTVLHNTTAAKQNAFFMAVLLKDGQALQILKLTQPDGLRERDVNGKNAIDLASKQGSADLVDLLNYKETQHFLNEEHVLPLVTVIHQNLQESDLRDYYYQRLTQLGCKPLGDLTKDKSELFVKLPYVAAMQAIAALDSLPQEQRIPSLLEWLTHISIFIDSSVVYNLMLQQILPFYSWNDLKTSGLLSLATEVVGLKNEALIGWFAAFFKPIDGQYITTQKWDASIGAFKDFMAKVQPYLTSLSQPPKESISLQMGGQAKLFIANKLLELAEDKTAQAYLLRSLPTTEQLASLQGAASKFPFISGELFIRDSYACKSNGLTGYIEQKVMLLCAMSTQSLVAYSTAQEFLHFLEAQPTLPIEKLLMLNYVSKFPSEYTYFIDYALASVHALATLGAWVWQQIHLANTDNTNLFNVIEVLGMASALHMANRPIDLSVHSLPKIHSDLTVIYQQLLDDKYKEIPVAELIEKFQSTAVPLPDIVLAHLQSRYVNILEHAQYYRTKPLSYLQNSAKSIAAEVSAGKPITEDKANKLIAILREIVRYEFAIYPYNTQIFIILSMLEERSEQKGAIAQVLTGEGKATIIAVLAAYFALTGELVDVITSSKALADRDYNKYKGFMEGLAIVSASIATPEPDPKLFSAQVLYGTNSDYEFALLRARLYQTQSYSPKERVAIVDEVDNLFLDTALNAARIAMASQYDLSWLYGPIFNAVTNSAAMLEVQPWRVKKLLKEKFPGHFAKFSSYLTTEAISQLIASANTAVNLEEGLDYVLRIDENLGQQKVIIVDWRNTGRLNYGSRWSKGIHEFLEVKHGLKPETESLTIASITHPAFFKQYPHIFGLTGTVGAAQEQNELKNIYDVDIYHTPSHFSSQKSPTEYRYVQDARHLSEVVKEVLYNSATLKRPVLVLFSSIESSENFSRILEQKRIKHKLLNEMQAANENAILQDAGKPGAVVVATNNAGRGTDIIPTAESLENGGLQVVVTFYPENQRVEDQDCGRAGRQGQKGSCLIIVSTDMQIKGLSSEVVFEELSQRREKKVKQLSEYRQESTKNQSDYYHIFDKFTDALVSIKANLQMLDASSNSQNYYNLTTTYNVTLCDLRRPALESMYSQGYRAIQAQQAGTFINWAEYLDLGKKAYLDSILFQWGEFFSNLDQRYASSNTNVSDAYTKFALGNLQPMQENPGQYFATFMETVFTYAANYEACTP